VLALGLEQVLGEDEVRVGVVPVADAVDREPEDRWVEAVGDLRGDAVSLFSRGTLTGAMLSIRPH
jgi:hypothetical protein